jgi:hypothetical protein
MGDRPNAKSVPTYTKNEGFELEIFIYKRSDTLRVLHSAARVIGLVVRGVFNDASRIS